MKQYLFKGIDGEYRVVDHDCQGRAVEIPEGCNYAYYSAQQSKVVFTTSDASYFYGGALWQRHTPTLEYLNPSDWSLHVINPENDAVPEDWVLVPDGAEKLYISKRGHDDCDFFLKKSDKFEYRYLKSKEWKEWPDLKDPDNFEQFALKWQRHTQPEPLPFIDDEIDIETARGLELDFIAKSKNLRDRYDGESDEDYRYQLQHYISKESSVLSTLNQRQQQYGDFEDVAETTEDLFQVLKGGASFVDLSKSQRMALYMICSKMARIVNGDVNYKDNWHDISGYSQLIDNKL